MTEEKDILSLYSESPIMAFTENDVFEAMGLRQTEQQELVNLIDPKQLNFISALFGMAQKKIS
jgi:hypothetical protein